MKQPTPPIVPDLDHPPAFLQCAGLHFDEVSPRQVTGWMQLGPDHHTPWGIVHGGCIRRQSRALPASAPRLLRASTEIAVGLTNTTNFLRPMTEGRVTVTGAPIQQGRTQQLWEVDIASAEGKLIAIGQVRLQNVPFPG